MSVVQRNLLFALVTGLVFMTPCRSNAQAGNHLPDSLLNALLDSMPALNTKVTLSLNAAPTKEVLQALAVSSKLNLGIDPSINGDITLHLEDVSSKDVISYLCQTQDLQAEYSNSILHLRKNTEFHVIPARSLSIYRDSANATLTMDLRSDSLTKIAQVISDISGVNIFVSNSLSGRVVSGYVKNLDVESSLMSLSRAWGISCRKQGEGLYYLESEVVANLQSTASIKVPEGIECRPGSTGRISIRGKGVDAFSLILVSAQQLSTNIVIPSQATHKVTLNMEDVLFEDILNTVLQGSGFIWSLESGTYTISETGSDILIYRFKHRSLEGIMECLPRSILESVELSSAADINSLVIKGPGKEVEALVSLLSSLDDTIPLILIEVIIIDHHSGHQIKTGISATIAQEEVANSGTLFPSPNLILNTATLNKILSTLSNFGWYNLGYLTPELTISLSALEEQGILNIKSTPKLATLNGHEASMSIGTTAYYVEERNDVIGTQNPQNIQTRQFKSVNADFSLKVQPFVSGDGRITLSVEVEQSDFTDRISPDAPPGMVTRKFTSIINLSDGQTVVLGGLEQKSIRETSSGLPLLSRIPVIKWFISSRNREKDKSNLVIFIHPTIIR